METTGNAHGHKSRAEYVVDFLRGEIVSGRLPAGSRIVQQEVAGKLGVSQTPVREALLILSGEGKVSLDPYRGVTVADLNEISLRHLYLLRTRVEGLLSRLAVEAQPKGLAEDLERIHKDLISTPPSAAIGRQHALNREFHFCLYRGAGSLIMSNFVENLWSLFPRQGRDPKSHDRVITLWGQSELRASLAGQHGDILAAVADGDPDRVEDAMIRHIAWSMEYRASHGAASPPS